MGGLDDLAAQRLGKGVEIDLDRTVFHGQAGVLGTEDDFAPVSVLGLLDMQHAQLHRRAVELLEPRSHVAAMHKQPALRLGDITSPSMICTMGSG